MKGKLLLFAITMCALFHNAHAQVPVVSNLSPASGSAGSNVTISGSNFSTSPAGNIVFFGGMRATVTAATAGSLTVTVPYGATYAPVSVTVNARTGYASRPFMVTFPGGGTLDANAFAQKIDSATDLHPNGLALADYDGDGLLDIATPNNYSTSGSPASVSILRNTSAAPAELSLATHFELITGVLTYAIAAGDLDGDGKPDLVSSSIVDKTISVFRNTSSTGNISFAAKMDLPTGDNPFSICITDMDGDGKPDIIVANFISGTVTIYHNTGNGAALSFARLDLPAGLSPQTVIATDLNGDGKPDLAITNKFANKFSVMTNVSVPGSIGFNARQEFTTGASPFGIASGDLDGDGKMDIAVSNNDANTISVFRNSGTGGNVNFEAKSDFNSGALNLGLTINDLNGDGKPDVVVASANTTIHENNSVPGTISFKPLVYTYLFPSPFMVGIGDLDNDGKPDLAAAGHTWDKVSILRNRCNEPSISSINPVTAGAGTTITITGNNFSPATSVTIGGVAATSFTIVSNTTITAVVPVTVSGPIVVRSTYGKGIYYGYIYPAPPTVTGFTPAATGRDSLVKITGSNFTGATGVSFGGIAAAGFTVIDATTIHATVGSGASGDVSVTNPYGTGTKAGFVYRPLPQLQSFTPAAAATGDTVVLQGKNFTPDAAVTFGNVPAAAVIFVNDSTLRAVVGAGADGNVVVTTSGGFAVRGDFYMLPGINSFTPASGGTGDVITITGTYFQTVTSVKFNNATANFIIVNSTTIMATVPGFASSGSITVANGYGGRSKSGFTFIAPPQLSAIKPVRGGAGTAVTITGNNFSNASSVKIGNIPVASFTVVSPTTITAVIGSGASGSVQVQTPGGSNTGLSFTYTTIPVIHAVTPLKAAPGASVTITGANFSSSIANLQAWFGGVQGTVTAASANSITVTVPNGALYAPVRILSNGLVAEAPLAFMPTFTGGGNFHSASMDAVLTYPAGRNPVSLKGADLDGDGKTDLVLSNYTDSTITIFRNTGGSGTASFATPVTFPAGGGPRGISIADMDNDGKPDIVYTNGGSGYGIGYVSILRNTATGASISFAPRQVLMAAPSAIAVATSDFNLDGRIDMLVVNEGQEVLVVYQNTGTTGSTINFQSRQNISLMAGGQYDFAYYSDIAYGDLNGDGRPELTFGHRSEQYKLIGWNGSSEQAIFFNIQESFLGVLPANVQIADLDGDGANDILATGATLRNTNGLGSFLARPANAGGVVALADLDGDGRVDLARAESPIAAVALMRNVSTAGSIDFLPGLQLPSGNKPADVFAGDLDGDGKPDLAVINQGDHSLTIYKNQAGSGRRHVCAGGGITLDAPAAGTAYQWQLNSGSGFTDITNGTNYSGSSAAALAISNVPAAWDGYEYRVVVDGTPSPAYVLVVKPSVQPAINLLELYPTTCANDNSRFYATVTNGGTAPKYTWTVNGVSQFANYNEFIRILNVGDQVRVSVKSNAACLSDSNAVSNIVTVQKLTPPAKPNATVSGEVASCNGMEYKVTFSSTNAIAGSIVRPVRLLANGYTTYPGQTFNGSTLTFTIPNNQQQTQNFTFRVFQPYGSGCEHETFTDTFVINHYVVDTPVVSLTGNILKVTNANANIAYTWQMQTAQGVWVAVVPAATDSVFAAPDNGTYRVKAVRGNCTLYSTEKTIDVTALPVVGGRAAGLKVYPNPVQRVLLVDGLNGGKWEKATIRTLDGRTLRSVSIRGLKKLSVDVTGLPAGYYLLALQGRQGSAVVQFVRQ